MKIITYTLDIKYFRIVRFPGVRIPYFIWKYIFYHSFCTSYDRSETGPRREHTQLLFMLKWTREQIRINPLFTHQYDHRVVMLWIYYSTKKPTADQTWRMKSDVHLYCFILRKLRSRIGNKVPQKHHNLIKTFLLSKWPFSMSGKRGGGSIISGKVCSPWCIHIHCQVFIYDRIRKFVLYDST